MKDFSFCIQELNPEIFDADNQMSYDASAQDDTINEEGQNAIAVWNTIKDLHMELLYMYHRVCLKLLTVPQGLSKVK